MIIVGACGPAPLPLRIFAPQNRVPITGESRGAEVDGATGRGLRDGCPQVKKAADGSTDDLSSKLLAVLATGLAL